MRDVTIGLLGGMETYATIHAFEQYATIFEAEKEWDRPRIIIDNRCTMPSRVRAILYQEEKEKLIDQMVESLEQLEKAGANYIILACNTSHVFLPDIYQKNPSLQTRVVNIIDSTVDAVEDAGIECVSLLASEGTIESRIYQDKLLSRGIKCVEPSEAMYADVRRRIEAVKQSNYSDDICGILERFTFEDTPLILGCTELPVLYNRYKDCFKGNRIFDPIEITLKNIKREIS